MSVSVLSSEFRHIAANRMASLPSRGAKAILFCVAGVLVSTSWTIPIVWLLAFGAVALGEIVLIRRYVSTRGGARAWLAVLAFAGVLIFASLALWLAITQGWPGRFIGAMMAASTLVQVLTYLFQARSWLMFASVPSALVLLAIPLLPASDHAPAHLGSILAMAIAVAGLFIDIGRSTLENRKVFRALSEARSAAEDAARSRQEFLDRMTHELRTPLNAVINYAEVLEEDLAGQSRADAERIKLAGRRLLSLVERVLALSELAHARAELSLAETDLADLIQACVHRNAALAAANGITITADVRISRWLSMDRAKVQTCVEELVANACRFTVNGAVEVEAYARDNEIVVRVSDTGPGLSGADLARIFHPFEQGDNSRTREHEGAGLGLALVQQLARRMGGDLTAASEPGRGATFLLRLAEHPEAGAGSRAAAKSATPTRL